MSRIITTHLTVDARVEALRGTLTDLADYRTWNPFITAADGTLTCWRAPGSYNRSAGRAMTFKPWITAIEQHRYIEWLGHVAAARHLRRPAQLHPHPDAGWPHPDPAVGDLQRRA